MLISKTVMVRWNGSTRKHYEARGYIWTKQNEYFEVKIEDLQKTSPVKVKVKCDYCGNVSEKSYRNRFKNEYVNKDCCSSRKCMVQKSEEVNLLKYGVKTFAQTDANKEHLRKQFQTPLSEVKRIANDKGLEILNLNDYENDRTRLWVICERHKHEGRQETNLANIKKNKHCCIFIKQENSSRRLDGKIVFNAFMDKGLIPMFKPEDYKTNSVPLPFVCPKHEDVGIQYRQYSNLKYANGCLKCLKDRTVKSLRTDQNTVFEKMIDKGYYPLNGEVYQNKDAHIQYRCSRHPEEIQQLTYSSLKVSNKNCKYCRNEDSIMMLNRRLRSSIYNWRNKIISECNSKCVLTGSEDYEVHHLTSFNGMIASALKSLSLDVKQSYTGLELDSIKNKVIKLHEGCGGVCLRPDLHVLFHQIYGKKDNTPEQFQEFALSYLRKKECELVG